MLNKLKNQSYPIPVSGKEGLIYSLSIGGFIALFLWFFEPFGMHSAGYTDGERLFFGVLTFVVFITAHNLLPTILPNIYKEEQWTVLKQVLFYLLLLFFVATLNGIYINYLENLPFSWGNYLNIIIMTIPVGAIPISLYVLLSFYWKYSKMQERAEEITEKIDSTPRTPDAVTYTIDTNLKGESFQLDSETFLFAKSNGNYIEVFVSGQKPELYRMNLMYLEKQLMDHASMLRCHRSYLVNTKQVLRLTGNAQGLKLWFDEVLFAPASRKYIEQIKAQIALLNYKKEAH